LIRPKLLPHQLRAGDNLLDINPEATVANTFLPTDLLEEYNGSIDTYKGRKLSPHSPSIS